MCFGGMEWAKQVRRFNRSKPGCKRGPDGRANLWSRGSCATITWINPAGGDGRRPATGPRLCWRHDTAVIQRRSQQMSSLHDSSGPLQLNNLVNDDELALARA